MPGNNIKRSPLFPKARARRLRATPALRALARETSLVASDFIAPFFIVHGKNIRTPISSMPGQFQLSIDQLLVEVNRLNLNGISSILLFGIPKIKDNTGSEAWKETGIVQLATRAVKAKFPNTVVFTDLCFCEYTRHGHCGIVKKQKNKTWDVENDATLKLIEKAALVQAKAGADFVAPSGMMDGAVASIRRVLDKNGFKNVGILAYAAKYASVFYGPFREAAGSSPQFGDRRTYQMDPANQREALREIREDIAEGADMIMVKPALSYLDVIGRVRREFDFPVVAYNVSGEYAMVKAAEKMGWLMGADDQKTAIEILTSIKRAGADLVITYHALDVARVLNRGVGIGKKRR